MRCAGGGYGYVGQQVQQPFGLGPVLNSIVTYDATVVVFNRGQISTDSSLFDSDAAIMGVSYGANTHKRLK